MTASEILVSVVVPIYNQADTIEETLRSALNQTHKNIEVIVVDDGSEADIKTIIDKLEDKRISFYRLTHKNANVARNYGIQRSKGKYIAMLDADDIWKPEHLADSLVAMKESAADGVYGSLILKDADTEEENIVMASKPNRGETMLNYLLRNGYGAQTSTLVLSAESVKDILWNPELNRHQDYDFVVRFSKKYKLAVKKKPTTFYILRSRSHEMDFHSCIKFIKANENDIEPINYYNYNSGMLRLALRLNAKPDIIKHYRREATYYRELLPYIQYIQICRPANKFERLVYKWRYLYYILRIKVEL